MSKKRELPDSQAEIDVQEDVAQQVEAVSVRKSDSEQGQEDVEEPAEISVAELQNQLEQAKQEAGQNWEKVLRIQAEMENLRKRTQKDLENAHKFALEKFAKELITVLDSLELGIQASTGDSPEIVKLREGSELTLKQFESVLSRFNIETINPLGEPFNPEWHQAMSMQVSEQYAPNTVMNVFQKGYLLNGRLLRPAMVVVAKAMEDGEQEKEQQT